VIGVHGGVKFYRGAAKAARTYVERDCARYDDYYLADGDGVAMRFVAEATGDGRIEVERKQDMDGETYEGWVAGVVVETGQPKGRLRKDPDALRFVEVTVNGPKTWSLAAALNPEVSAALDAAQERAATQIIAYLAGHATTRVGPRGRQVRCRWSSSRPQ
jgi:exodeoxyribonuclease V alpha subunit